MFQGPAVQEARLVIQGCALHPRRESHIQQKKQKTKKPENTKWHKDKESSKSQGETLTRASKKFKMPFPRARISLQKLTHYCQAPVTIINCECNLINSNKLNPSLSISSAKAMAGHRGEIPAGAVVFQQHTLPAGGGLRRRHAEVLTSAASLFQALEMRFPRNCAH